MPLIIEEGKEIYDYFGKKFRLEDIAIPRDIAAPPNLKEEDIPKYEKLDLIHYKAAQIHFFDDRRWFKGCDEHREIKMEELNDEISGPLERAFRWCYFQKFKEDKSKVKKIEANGLFGI